MPKYVVIRYYTASTYLDVYAVDAQDAYDQAQAEDKELLAWAEPKLELTLEDVIIEDGAGRQVTNESWV